MDGKITIIPKMNAETLTWGDADWFPKSVVHRASKQDTYKQRLRNSGKGPSFGSNFTHVYK